MNNNKFVTDPKPSYFTGEDVIGDEVYQSNRQQIFNRIPQQLLSKLQQNPIPVNTSDIEYESEEEIHIQQSQPIQVNYQPEQVSNVEVITKNIKINLEINLKINVI